MARVMRLNEAQLRGLVRSFIRENLKDGEGYKIYFDPKNDQAIDEIVEFIDLHRQESGKRWPVLLNGGNEIQARGEPFDGYYAIGFDDPNEASEFVDEVRYLVNDAFTEDESSARADIEDDARLEKRYGSGSRRRSF
jgi:hypothetical protein